MFSTLIFEVNYLDDLVSDSGQLQHDKDTNNYISGAKLSHVHNKNLNQIIMLKNFFAKNMNKKHFRI